MENEVQMLEGLTEGRMVHYVLDEGDADRSGHRPAVIVNVWDKVTGCSNLQVFMDSDGTEGFNDGMPNVVWQTSILYSEEKEPGTWHWIEPA